MGRLLRVLRDPDKIRVYIKSKVTQFRVRQKLRGLRRNVKTDLKLAPVIWLRTPKCASSSILAGLEITDSVVNCIKSPNMVLSDDLLRTKVICISAGDKERFIERHPEVWASAFKWAVVRNPNDRAVSAWRYLKALQVQPLEAVLDDPPTKELAPNEYHHFTRSYSSMLGVSGQLGVDEVLKFESLDTQLPDLFQKIGIPFAGLAHVNETPGRKPNGAAIGDTARKKIRQMFRDDFEQFGYE